MNDLAFGATLLSLLAMLTCAACLEATRTTVRHTAPAPTTLTAARAQPVHVAGAGPDTTPCACTERTHSPVTAR